MVVCFICYSRVEQEDMCVCVCVCVCVYVCVCVCERKREGRGKRRRERQKERYRRDGIYAGKRIRKTCYEEKTCYTAVCK